MKPTKQNTMEAIYLQSSLQFGETLKSVSDSDYRRLRDNYDALLKQPLQLGFFVPCDENGNVLDPSDAFRSCEKGFLYGKAKERVLFKGFINKNTRSNRKQFELSREFRKYINFDIIETDAFGLFFYDSRNEKSRLNTIEDLLKFQEFELTPTAIKQIGL